MEPEGSLPDSQVPANCPYPQPARSSPYPTTHFLKVHLNIILPSTPGSPKWSLSLRFPQQKAVFASPLPIRATCPAHLILHFINRTILCVQYRLLSSSLYSFLHSTITSSLLGRNTLLNTIFSNTLSLRSSLNVSDQVSHPYNNYHHIIQTKLSNWRESLPFIPTWSYSERPVLLACLPATR